MLKKAVVSFVILLFVYWLSFFENKPKNITLLNVSYDATREFYKEYNQLFSSYWLKKTGQKVDIAQSHGGSAKQARSVIEGLQADVATLALAYDIDNIAQKSKLLPLTWQKRLPYNSSPYHSIIVFLVRKGNPKNIKDWDDLIKPGVKIITPSPKSSGAARWVYLAAYNHALSHHDHNPEKAKEFMKQLFKNVPVLDSGARAATTNFIERGLGDVLLSWESEALLVQNKIRPQEFVIINPSSSILAEPVISLVDQVAKRKNTTLIAQEYLTFLYEEGAQRLIAKHYYRPSNPQIAKQYNFLPTSLTTIEELGGWQKIQTEHFVDGALFDQITVLEHPL